MARGYGSADEILYAPLARGGANKGLASPEPSKRIVEKANQIIAEAWDGDSSRLLLKLQLHGDEASEEGTAPALDSLVNNYAAIKSMEIWPRYLDGEERDYLKHELAKMIRQRLRDGAELELDDVTGHLLLCRPDGIGTAAKRMLDGYPSVELQRFAVLEQADNAAPALCKLRQRLREHATEWAMESARAALIVADLFPDGHPLVRADFAHPQTLHLLAKPGDEKALCGTPLPQSDCFSPEIGAWTAANLTDGDYQRCVRCSYAHGLELEGDDPAEIMGLDKRHLAELGKRAYGHYVEALAVGQRNPMTFAANAAIDLVADKMLSGRDKVVEHALPKLLSTRALEELDKAGSDVEEFGFWFSNEQLTEALVVPLVRKGRGGPIAPLSALVDEFIASRHVD